jgi:hypothetical protein
VALAAQRYKKEERESIMRLVWAYIWSATEEELETRRTEMKDVMRVPERLYVDKHRRLKERQVIRCFTPLVPNLNCFTT